MVDSISSGTGNIEAYWSHVERAEREIRANAHLGRLPPMCFGDPWDDDFAQAYEGIHPLLKQFWRQRCYAVPAGLAFRPMPLLSETGHQGLMFFLNKPDELFGERGVLDSVEYKRIKTDAMEEWKGLVNRSHEALAERPIRRRIKRENREVTEDDVLLHAFLVERHRCNTDEPNCTAVGTQQFIADELGKSTPGWNPTRVFRSMKRLMGSVKGFEHCGPMATYRRLCKSDQICSYLTTIFLRMGSKGLKREIQIDEWDRVFVQDNRNRLATSRSFTDRGRSE